MLMWGRTLAIQKLATKVCNFEKNYRNSLLLMPNFTRKDDILYAKLNPFFSETSSPDV